MHYFNYYFFNNNVWPWLRRSDVDRLQPDSFASSSRFAGSRIEDIVILSSGVKTMKK